MSDSPTGPAFPPESQVTNVHKGHTWRTHGRARADPGGLIVWTGAAADQDRNQRSDVTRTGNPPRGHWMIAQLGEARRAQHFVAVGAQCVRTGDGWIRGYRALCGVESVPADRRYRAAFPSCDTCERARPEPTGCC